LGKTNWIVSGIPFVVHRSRSADYFETVVRNLFLPIEKKNLSTC
jgi:hypothetical protein